MDFMSSFVFRLFENLNVIEGDPSRFKLEIMVNRGATVNREVILKVINHTVPIEHKEFLDINKSLTLEQLETFFAHLLTMQETPIKSPTLSESVTPVKFTRKSSEEKNGE